MAKIDEEIFPCMVSGEIIQLTKLVGDFATDEKGNIYKYLPGEINEARRVTNFTSFKANSLDEAMEYFSHRIKESIKGNKLKIYSVEDFIDYINQKGGINNV